MFNVLENKTNKNYVQSFRKQNNQKLCSIFKKTKQTKTMFNVLKNKTNKNYVQCFKKQNNQKLCPMFIFISNLQGVQRREGKK